LRDLAATELFKAIVDFIGDLSSRAGVVADSGASFNLADAVGSAVQAAQALSVVSKASCADVSFSNERGGASSRLESATRARFVQWLERQGFLKRITSLPAVLTASGHFLAMRIPSAGASNEYQFQTLD